MALVVVLRGTATGAMTFRTSTGRARRPHRELEDLGWRTF